MTAYRQSTVHLLFTTPIMLGTLGCMYSGVVSSESNDPETTPSVSTSEPSAQQETSTEVKSSSETSSGSQSEPANERRLIDAAVAGDLQAIRELVESGADLDERYPQSNGATALIAAATYGQVESIRLLIEAGADLEVKNNDGSTALLTAAFMCEVDTVELLLESGADRDAANNEGTTALDSVSGPFETARPVYDLIKSLLGPHGLEMDYEYIKETRPKIAEILRQR